MNVGIMNVGILNKTPLIARQKGHYKLLPLLVSARMRISNKYLTMVIKYIFWNHIVHDKYFQNPPILMGRNRCWYCNDDVSRVEKNICAGCKQVTLQITFSKVGFVHLVKQRLLFPIFLRKIPKRRYTRPCRNDCMTGTEMLTIFEVMTDTVDPSNRKKYPSFF